MSLLFNGQLLVTPVTASVVDDSGMIVSSTPNSQVLALVGEADSGEPFAVTRINSYQDAVALLGSGRADLLKAFEKAFNPSPDTNSPAYILFARADDDEQAQGYLVDTSSTNAILVKAKQYGAAGANIRVIVANGTQANTKKVTVKNTINGVLSSNFQDNLAANMLSVVYGGAGTVATVAITATALTLTVDAVPTELLFSVYPTIQDIVDKLNTIADVTALVLDNSNTTKSITLDALASTSCKTTALVVRALLQKVVDTLNTRFSNVVAERLTGALKAPANTATTGVIFSYTPHVGATTENWQAAFDALKEVDCQVVVPLSDSETVLYMSETHCDYMSLVARMERRTICGLPALTSNDTAIATAAAINHQRVSVVHQGFYDPDNAGVNTLWQPWVLASLLGGMLCGVSAGTPLTNKIINVRGMERRLRNPDETDLLLAGGVLCCWSDFANNVKVLQSISTAQTANFSQREISVGVASDFVARAIREALDPLRGQKNTPYLLAEVKSRAESRLKLLATDEPQGDGVITGDAKNPAWKGLTVTQGIDYILVEFQCSPVIPSNYIGITIHTVPYSGTTA